MVLNQLIMAYDKTKSRRLNGQTPQIKSHNILSLFGPLIVATAMLKEIGTGDNKQIFPTTKTFGPVTCLFWYQLVLILSNGEPFSPLTTCGYRELIFSPSLR